MTLVPSAAPTKTYKDIIVFVNLLENSGVKTACLGDHDQWKIREIAGLYKRTFDKKRKLINDHLRGKFGQRYVNFPDIHFPQHYDRDGVQIREKWQFSKE